MSIFSLAHEDIVKTALMEDLGRGQDLTSQILPADQIIKTAVNARESGIVCGTRLAQMAFAMICKDIKCDIQIADGRKVSASDTIMTISGPAQNLLAAERTALNFMTHLSGIASQTHQYVEAVKHTKASITCTRKTLPGLRALQKYAVKTGGGRNHRFALDDGILIKDNHIASCGSIEKAVENARKNAGHMVCIEIEVDTLEQLETALKTPINAVLLDNMSPETLKEAVSMVDGRILTEASGGITLETVQKAAESGVNMISVGALTHSTRALDLGLDIIE